MAGVKFDQEKARWDLVPFDGFEGTVKALTFGAKKYSDRNWEEGMDYGRVFAAAMRHLTAWWGGETYDPESGLNHLHHAGCCILFLQSFHARDMDGNKFDDRPSMDDAPVRVDHSTAKQKSPNSPLEVHDSKWTSVSRPPFPDHI